jgi:hypothetical protein
MSDIKSYSPKYPIIFTPASLPELRRARKPSLEHEQSTACSDRMHAIRAGRPHECGHYNPISMMHLASFQS